MAIRRKLGLFAAGFGLSLFGALLLRDELLVSTRRHIEALEIIEKDIKGEVYIRKDKEEFGGLMKLIRDSYRGKWVKGVEKSVNP